MSGLEALAVPETDSQLEPFAFARPTYNRLGYEIWLPEGNRSGCIRTYADPGHDVKFLPHYIIGCEREIQDIVAMTSSGLGPSLAELGYVAEHDEEARRGYTTYPSSEYLAWRLTAPTIEKGLGLPIFITRSGDNNFGMVEATEALARGGVLLSNSTKRYAQWATDTFTEPYTLMGHDVLTHAPGWLGLPPQIFAEFITAAQEAMQAYYEVSDGDWRSKATVEQRIREIQSYIDSTISSPSLRYLGQYDQSPGFSTGKKICKIIGPNALHRPSEYEYMIRSYMLDPVALKEALEIDDDTSRITIARLALQAA
jgi:hypothetical protein